MQSTRQIFDRLAHSSIMRLNESSMEKLFDLMAMGFKLQLVSCRTPREVVDVSLKHLEELNRIVEGSPQVRDLLEECKRRMHEAYDRMAEAELDAMRQCLCTFFQDRKVKVSLFLQDRTQKNDGSIVVPSSGMLVPDDMIMPATGCQELGSVRYFENEREVRRETLLVASSSVWKSGHEAQNMLGSNLYMREQSANPGDVHAPHETLASPAATSTPSAQDGSASVNTAAAVGELNMLASLIGTQPVAVGEEIKLEQLFAANVGLKDPNGPILEVIQIDGTRPSDFHLGLDTVRQQMEGGITEEDARKSDDLLDLLDRA